MTQNSVISANYSVPGFIGAMQKSMTRGISVTDDTFMNMLSERIAARSESGEKSRPIQKTDPFKAGPMKTEESIIKDEVKDVKKPEKNATVKTSESKVMETRETKSAGEAERVEVKEDRPKEETEEEINTLEAMIALLEELMARLDAKVVIADPVSLKTTEQILPMETESVSPMELLMALMEGNIEKLKKMMNELGEGQQTPEVNELFEKIKSLVEELSKSEGEELTSELSIGIESEEPTHEEIFDQLKTKCEQLIEKLRQQVSTLREALPKDSEEDLTQLMTSDVNSEEPVKVENDNGEAKAQTDNQDTEGKSEVLEQNHHAKLIDKDSGNSFDKFVIQNNQIATETVKDTATTAKTTTVLAEKPLEQTVTNQVMMKVKLMAGENKQEMEMHLKPENLGKLSLKIIHERGEILAKITAENEQVKGILESNMQLLRDALEKSGLSVQSLSVSVGNGQGNDQTKENSAKNGKAATGGISREEIKSSIKDTLDIRARIEKEYFNQSSQINLTA